MKQNISSSSPDQHFVYQVLSTPESLIPNDHTLAPLTFNTNNGAHLHQTSYESSTSKSIPTTLSIQQNFPYQQARDLRIPLHIMWPAPNNNDLHNGRRRHPYTLRRLPARSTPVQAKTDEETSTRERKSDR
jgi:hypothetical protein